MEKFLFNVQTPLGFFVHTTAEYWNIICTLKHPVMTGAEDAVKRCLSDPDEIRLSKTDEAVFLFYRKAGIKRYLCAVSKIDDGNGFLVTSYPTDAIKEGVVVWKK